MAGTVLRWCGRAAAAVLATVLPALTASAATAADVQSPLTPIAVDATTYPTVTVKVAAPVPPAEGDTDIPESAFTVTEDGTPQTVDVIGPADTPLEIALLIDTSAVVDGDMLSAAGEAIGEFLAALPDHASASLVVFGGEADVLTPMSASTAVARADLALLEAGGDRQLHDAVATGVEQFSPAPSNRRSMVVFTTGADTAGTMPLSEASRALAASRASLYVINATAGARPEGLDELVQAAGGGVLDADEPGDLAALYERVALRLGNEYRLAFSADGRGPTEVTVHFALDGVDEEFTRTVDFPSAAAPTPEPTADAAPPPPTRPAAVPEQAPPADGAVTQPSSLLEDVTIAVGLLVGAVAVFAAGLVAFFWMRSAPQREPASVAPGGAVRTRRATVDAGATARPGVADPAPAASPPAGPAGSLAAPVVSPRTIAPEEPLISSPGTAPVAALAASGLAPARPGQAGYLAVAGDEPADRPAQRCRRTPVAVTLVDGQDHRTLVRDGPGLLLRHRIARMAADVAAAGGVATVADLACLTGSDAGAVREALADADAPVRDDPDAGPWGLDSVDVHHYEQALHFTRDTTRTVDAYFARRGELPVQPGDVCYQGISAHEPPDKPVRACSRVVVRLQLVVPSDLGGVPDDSALRRRRLARLTRQAQVQHALLTVEDLVRLLGVPAATVRGDVLALRIAGEDVPVFGHIAVGDQRPAPEVVAVIEYLSGGGADLAPDDGDWVAEFSRTVLLHRRGTPVTGMQLGGSVGTALLGQFVALYECASRESESAARLAKLFE